MKKNFYGEIPGGPFRIARHFPDHKHFFFEQIHGVPAVEFLPFAGKSQPAQSQCVAAVVYPLHQFLRIPFVFQCGAENCEKPVVGVIFQNSFYIFETVVAGQFFYPYLRQSQFQGEVPAVLRRQTFDDIGFSQPLPFGRMGKKNVLADIFFREIFYFISEFFPRDSPNNQYQHHNREQKDNQNGQPSRENGCFQKTHYFFHADNSP